MPGIKLGQKQYLTSPLPRNNCFKKGVHASSSKISISTNNQYILPAISKKLSLFCEHPLLPDMSQLPPCVNMYMVVTNT